MSDSNEQTRNKICYSAMILLKKTNFNKVKDEEVKVTQDCINKMPRKMFNYASSIDLFNKVINISYLKSKKCPI